MPQPTSAPEAPAPLLPPPASPSAADSIVAAAFKTSIGTPAQDLEPSPGAASSLMAPGIALLALAVLALGLKKRQRVQGGSLKVIEAASLGPRRSLVIAEVMGERMALAVSEAGVTVLAKQPLPVAQHIELVTPVALSMPAPAMVKPMSMLERLKGHAPSFDAHLRESIEDQELRAKLAKGVRGVVP